MQNRFGLLVVFGAAILALGLMTRYTLATTERGIAYKLDRWTGKTWYCTFHYQGIELSCLELRDRKPGFEALDAALEELDTKNKNDH